MAESDCKKRRLEAESHCPLPEDSKGDEIIKGDAEKNHNHGCSESQNMGPTTVATLQRLRQLLDEAIYHLEGRYPPTMDAVAWTALVYESMNTSGRVYHNVQHIFDVTSHMKLPEHPIPILAALFHDIIYLTIDHHISAHQNVILSDVVHHYRALPLKSPTGDPAPESHELVFNMHVRDPLVNMVCSMFGYVLGLPRRRRNWDETNEYLSAVVAVRLLKSCVTLKHLFQIAACIEASVPFRPVEEEDQPGSQITTKPMEALYQRLRGTNQEFQVGLTEQELVETVQQAAFFANCDLAPFQDHDRRTFLTQTWRLLPEWKPALLHPPLLEGNGDPGPFIPDGSLARCELHDVYQALVLLTERYRHVNIRAIFQSFRGSPDGDTLQAMQQVAGENVAVVGVYAHVRLFTLRLLMDCLAVALGAEEHETILHVKAGGTFCFLRRVDAFALQSWKQLTQTPVDVDPLRNLDRCPEDWIEEVHNWLMDGRPEEFVWDAAQAPLAAYIYSQLGGQVVEWAQNLNAQFGEVLSRIPRSMLEFVVDVLRQVLPDYETELRGLLIE